MFNLSRSHLDSNISYFQSYVFRARYNRRGYNPRGIGRSGSGRRWAVPTSKNSGSSHPGFSCSRVDLPFGIIPSCIFRVFFRSSLVSLEILISIFSYVSVRAFVRLPMLGPGNARWLCLSLSFSRRQFFRLSRTRVLRLSASPAPIPFPSNLNNAAASPLPLSPSITPSLSLARLIDPDPVLFSSLFDSRRVTHTDSHAASRLQGLSGGGWRERGRVEEETRGSGKDGRTGPTHRSRDIHFHFIFLARYRRQRKVEREKERKRKKTQRTARTSARFEEEAIRKNFGHSPESALIGRGFSIRFAPIPTRDFAREKKKETRCKGYVAGAA